MEDDDRDILYVRDKRTQSTFLLRTDHRFKSILSPILSQKLIKPSPFIRTVDGCQAPKSLFDLCKHLVVLNLNFVASFKGFPELVGEQLFKDAVEMNLFSNDFENEYCFRRLNLFVNEYSAMLLTQLNCSGQYILLAEPIWRHLNVLLGFSLVKLDVSQCNISDDHPIFNSFQKFSSLTHLRLTDNYISVDGVRMLTLSVRVAGKGPVKLAHLDLSGNSFLTKEALKLVENGFKHLEFLNLSRTLILDVDCEILLRSGFSINSDERRENMETFSTLGWATDLLAKWRSNCPAVKLDSLSSKFYGHSKQKERNKPYVSSSNRLILIKTNGKLQAENAALKSDRRKRRMEKKWESQTDDDELFVQYF